MIDPNTGIDDGSPVYYEEDPTAPWNSDYNPPAEEVVTTSPDPGNTTTENKVNWMLVIAIAIGLYLLRKK